MEESRIEVERTDDGLPCVGIYARHRQAGRRGLVTLGVLPRTGYASVGNEKPDCLLAIVERRPPGVMERLARLRVVPFGAGGRECLKRQEPWRVLERFVVEPSPAAGKTHGGGHDWWRLRVEFGGGLAALNLGEIWLSAAAGARLGRELTRLFIDERAALMARPDEDL